MVGPPPDGDIGRALALGTLEEQEAIILTHEGGSVGPPVPQAGPFQWVEYENNRMLAEQQAMAQQAAMAQSQAMNQLGHLISVASFNPSFAGAARIFGHAMGFIAPSEEDLRKQKDVLDRAYALLESTIGKKEASKVEAGGAYLIRSKLWPSVYYGVARTGRVLILERGWLRRRVIIGESCIQSVDGGLPWPDVVLAKIMAIQADETIVFATGNVTGPEGQI